MPVDSKAKSDGGDKVEYVTQKQSVTVYASETARFLSRFTSIPFLDVVSKSWRNFSEYFLLLFLVAKQGRAQRLLLHCLNVDIHLLDFYLGSRSPYEPGNRPRDVMGNKQTKPDWHYLIATASLLVGAVAVFGLLCVCLLCTLPPVPFFHRSAAA